MKGRYRKWTSVLKSAYLSPKQHPDFAFIKKHAPTPTHEKSTKYWCGQSASLRKWNKDGNIISICRTIKIQRNHRIKLRAYVEFKCCCPLNRLFRRNYIYAPTTFHMVLFHMVSFWMFTRERAVVLPCLRVHHTAQHNPLVWWRVNANEDGQVKDSISNSMDALQTWIFMELTSSLKFLCGV